MPRRPIQPDRLAVSLQRFQPPDDVWPQQETDDQGRQARGTGAERDVAEQVEKDELVRQGSEDIVEHQPVPIAAVEDRAAVASIASTTHFIPLPRLPLTRIASPSAILAATTSARPRESAACAPRIRSGTLSNNFRIKGPQVNRQSAEAVTASARPACSAGPSPPSSSISPNTAIRRLAGCSRSTSSAARTEAPLPL